VHLATAIGTVFALIGAHLAVVAGRRFRDRLAFLRRSVVASGVVIALRSERDAMDNRNARYPRIRFHTASGREIAFESGMARGGTAWNIGDTVPVRYRRDHPETAELDGFAPLWGATALFTLLAVVFLGVGAGLLFRVIPL
jgi:hypothetical protein